MLFPTTKLCVHVRTIRFDARFYKTSLEFLGCIETIREFSQCHAQSTQLQQQTIATRCDAAERHPSHRDLCNIDVPKHDVCSLVQNVSINFG